jgi:hypothetical protein
MIEKYLHSFGLTKQKKREESDLLCDNASVSKKYVPEEDKLILGIAIGNPALGRALSRDEKYMVSFKGPKVSFEVDDKKLYNRFNTGDSAQVIYREIIEKVYDFVPPDFNNRKEIDRYVVDNKVVSVTDLNFVEVKGF